MTATTLEDRFWARVQKTPGGCWLWTSARGSSHDPSLYGMFDPGDGRGSRGAHRISWEIHHGRPVPEDLFVLHTCDTPACVNPQHLFLGTHVDNMRDMVAKGRAAKAPK